MLAPAQSTRLDRRNVAAECPSMPAGVVACRKVIAPKGVATSDPFYTTSFGLDGRHRTRAIKIRTPDGVDRVQDVTWTDQNLLATSEDFKNQQTSYTYDGAGRALTVTSPDPDGAGPLGIPVVTNRYDENYDGLQGSYYNNQTLTPPAVLRRLDPDINDSWGAGSPGAGVNSDNFSVRWTGYLKVPTAGSYTFTLASDDGSRLYVDGELLIDHWGLHGVNPAKSSAPVALQARLYPIVVEYFDGPVTAEVYLKWGGPGIATGTPIPSTSLTPGFNLGTSSVDPAGNTATYVYEDETPPNYTNDEDAFFGNLIETQTTNTPIGGSAETLKSRFGYNTYGQQTSKTLPKGMTGASPDPAYTTTYAYYGDENATNSCTGAILAQDGLIKSTAQPGLATITHVHDGQGASVSVADGMGTTCATYDALGRALTGKTPDRATASTYTYDQDGRLKTVADPLQPGTSTYTYDDLGRLATAKDAMAAIGDAAATYAYDNHSNVSSRTDKTGTTGYLYDQMDRLIQVTDPGSRVYATTYDENSLLTKQTFPNSTETQVTYDNLNRVDVQKTVTTGVGTLLAQNDYERDIRGLIKRDDSPQGMWAYTYDALGRLEQAHDPSSGRTRRYSFDINANRTETKLNRGWDTFTDANSYAATDGLATTISGDNACGDVPLGFTFPFAGSNYTNAYVSTNGYLYLGNSNCSGTSVDPVTTTSRLIAPYNRDLKIDTASIANPGRGIFVETYNPTLSIFSTRIRWKAELAGTTTPANFEVLIFPSGNVHFRYNTMPSGSGRVGVSEGNQIDFVAPFAYDRKTISSNAANQRFSKQAESSQATYGYNALDQLTATGGITGIAHNSDGDQTSITGPSPRGTVTLGYDGRHLTTSQTANSVTTNWLIDGEARVTKQTKGAAETRYRYNTPGGAPAWEENSSGTITASFVQGPLGVLATNTSGTMSYPVYNGHGDVIQTSDSADKFNYDEYGDVVSTAKPARYGYVGKWQKDREEDSSLIRMV